MAIPALTQSDFQATLKMKTFSSAKNLLNQLTVQAEMQYNNFWQNPKLTPQQAADALGTDAVTLRHLWLALVSFVNTVQPGTLTFNEPALTENQDGSITVTAS